MASTLHDVARLAGVSIKTVSNVIHDYPHIRPATRERVERAIAELGYTPNLTARSLRSGRTGAIALAVPELGLSYFAELAASVIEAAEEAGVVVLVEQTGGDRDRELELLRSPRLKMTDGLIFSPLGMGQDDVERLDVPYPLVVLGERIFDGPADHVTMQNVEAARAATDFLLRAGRRRIAIIGAHEGEVIGSAGLRLRGYREALEAAGVPYDESIIGYTTLWHRANGARCMRELLDRGADFDAVFGLNDTLALGAMRALQESGRRVPRGCRGRRVRRPRRGALLDPVADDRGSRAGVDRPHGGAHAARAHRRPRRGGAATAPPRGVQRGASANPPWPARP